MTLETCAREDELLDALGRAFVSAELREHIDSCVSCRELHLAATAVLEERSGAMSEADVPSAGTMWWRLQLRRRQDAQRAASRILLAGQALTLAIAVFCIVRFFGDDLVNAAHAMKATLRISTAVLIAIVATIVAVPFAAWAAIRQK